MTARRKKEALREENAPKTLGQRYKNGDKTVVPKIVRILKTRMIRDNKVTSLRVGEISNAFHDMGEHGDPATQKLIGELALIVYRRLPPPQKRDNEDIGWAVSRSPAEALLYSLFNYGNEQVVPIALDIYNRKVRIVEPVKALIRLEGANYSTGALTNMQVGLDIKNESDYKVMVAFKDRVFIHNVENMGEWYDTSSMDALLNKLLEYAGTNKRFVPIDTGDQTAMYIFGEPEKVDKLVKKYNL